ncbi:hypothetical protein J8L73_07445 [Pseudoalteromonas sp. MMG006]|uniref:hypothetical protein n=1 Tax=Pseudoalteromonas sp. MMG006 TaxID=2822683 RepID=UPI001B380595|nr:hypothetical protein [Pseudoalteromonas sp. MMG006]MBQ4798964.1 hypothetical protein [Pseudoalteromonas sp. MMG006]
MEKVEEKIYRFRTYNRAMIAAALSKSNRCHQGLPAKLLLCSIFDSLSIAAFPNETAVGKRYRQTVSKHSGWAYHDRVSLLQLCGVLDGLSQVPSSFSALNCWAQTEKHKRFAVSNGLLSSHKGLEADPTLQEVLAEWPHQSIDQPEKLDGKFLPSKFTHKNMLWMYRNKLAHEFSLPGTGAESPFRMEFAPYYQEVSMLSDIDPVSGLIFSNRWELVYPTGFFVQIAKSSLESIFTDYRISGTNPFLSYQESSLWL